MKKLYFLLLIYFLFQSNTSIAHPGGHYHKGDGIALSSWKLTNGEVIKGNFSFSKGNRIFLEQEEGHFISIPIENLCVQDQQFARSKMNKILILNNKNNEPLNYFDNFKFIPLSIFLLILFYFLLFKFNVLQYYIFKSKWSVVTASSLFSICIFIACSKSSSTSTISSTNNTTTNPVEVVLPKTNTAFIDSAFAAFKPAISTTWDNNYFYIASNGIPNHNMMVGITSWQQQVPITQPYTGTNSWSIPLQPIYALIPLSTKTNLMKGAVAVAVNGIPIFNALNNRGEDSYKIGELDNWGGHCGRGDDYHYHAAPLHLSTINGLKPIAFALDGFAVYGTKEPDGSTMMNLDTCHGHSVLNGVYHYHGTADYPYVVGALKGKVTLDPTTTAPENQIIPQAFTKPVRPATSPLNGAVIVDFTSVGTNGYLLTYKIGNKNGYVKYSWDATNKYTFILTDTAGVAVTNTYQR